MYKKKYLKYKKKYLNLKYNNLNGGSIDEKGIEEEKDIELNEILDLISEKNKILLCVHVDWCVHCIDFINKEYKLLKKEDNDVNIYKINGEKTDISKFLNENFEGEKEIIGFPSIFKIEKNKIISFGGDRSIKSLLKFYK